MIGKNNFHFCKKTKHNKKGLTLKNCHGAEY